MQQKKLIRKKVLELAKEAAEIAGVELDDVELPGQVGRMIVRVTIDSDDGIGISDCEEVSRQLEALLDVEDPIPGSYTLEVSSPGLDRPLRKKKDFERFTGRLARVVTKEKIDNKTFFVGRISGIDGESVLLLLKGKAGVADRVIEVPFDKISKARLEIEIR